MAGVGYDRNHAKNTPYPLLFPTQIIPCPIHSEQGVPDHRLAYTSKSSMPVVWYRNFIWGIWPFV